MKSAFLTLTLATSALLAAEPAKPAPAVQSAPSTAKVVDLRVESQTNPTAVNTPLPRFSWRIETEERGWLQTAYHILVASTPELLAQDKGDLWDSGEKAERNSQLVPLHGPPLLSEQEFHWKVRSQNLSGQFTDWSAAAASRVKLAGPAPLPSPLYPENAPRLSSFKCSDPALNLIFEAAAARLHEITSVRDIGLSMRAVGFHTSLLPNANDWLEHLNNSVNRLGYYPASLPADGSFGSTQSEAGISCAHALCWMTGDTTPYARNFGTMKRYIFARKDYANTNGKRPFGEVPADTLPEGDATPPTFIDDTTQALNLRLLLDVITWASRDPYEAYSLNQYNQSLGKPYAASHLNADGRLKYESVAACLLALRSGMLSADTQKQLNTELLLDLLEEERPKILTTSPIVAAHLLPVLTWTGHHDEAIKIAGSHAAEDLDPLALALCSEWLISMVAGIDSSNPAFSLIRLQPRIPAKDILASAQAHYDSPYGRISISWHHEKDGLHFDVTIPPNCLAVIELPARASQQVTESGNPLGSSKLFFAEKRTNSSISFQTGSGSYRFLVKN